jgi:hypothetical protein
MVPGASTYIRLPGMCEKPPEIPHIFLLGIEMRVQAELPPGSRERRD